jgi:hypothetical protein
MTRCETIHLILNPQDKVTVQANEACTSASVQVGDFPVSFTLTFKTEHIPQIEQLLNALWIMQEQIDQQSIQKLEPQWETEPLYLVAVEF